MLRVLWVLRVFWVLRVLHVLWVLGVLRILCVSDLKCQDTAVMAKITKQHPRIYVELFVKFSQYVATCNRLAKISYLASLAPLSCSSTLQSDEVRV
jgi:hypothetical protein